MEKIIGRDDMLIYKRNFKELTDRVTKLERILEQVEHRQVYYIPTAKQQQEGRYGTSGGYVLSLGYSMQNRDYVPVKDVVTKVMEFLGIRIEALPPSGGKLIVMKTSSGGSCG